MEVQGISYLAIEVSDLKRAAKFYHEVLGFEPLGRDLVPDCGRHVALRAASGQWLILSQDSRPRSLPETGVHQAYRVSPGDRQAISERATAKGITVHTYKEDRPAEEKDHCYFYDPDGNRIQLVAARNHGGSSGKVVGIDHAAVECCDLEWAEDFYVKALGLPVDHRVGWRTEDYVRAKLWGEGKEHMAPGTRRWDQRYTVMDEKRRLPRANMQLYVRFGDAVLGIYLALEHRQEPPEEQMAGTPRVAFRARRQTLDEAAERLSHHRFPFQGPVEHSGSAPIATSVYFKDPGGNFLELCVPR